MRDSIALAYGNQEPEPYPLELTLSRGLAGGIEPHSPLMLAQEMVNTDWQVVIASLLHVRTGRKQGHTALWAFLQMAPGPICLMYLPNYAGIKEILRPCGLVNKRLQVLLAMSAQWRRGIRPNEPGDMFGCGPYICDSYRLFVKGDLRRSPDDGELRAYTLWCMKQRRQGKSWRLKYTMISSDMEHWETSK